MKLLVEGIAASGGKARGRVAVASSLDELANRDFSEIVMVAEMIDPSVSTVIPKVVAIVTDEGGILCHAASVAREMRIPCVAGTGHGTSVLKEGMEVLVDGDEGRVFEASSE